MNADEAKARAEEAFEKIKEIAEAAWKRGDRGEQGPRRQGEGATPQVEGQGDGRRRRCRRQGEGRRQRRRRRRRRPRDTVEKAQELAAKADDKAIDLTEKDDGVVGTAAGAAHEVLDKVDGD